MGDWIAGLDLGLAVAVLLLAVSQIRSGYLNVAIALAGGILLSSFLLPQIVPQPQANQTAEIAALRARVDALEKRPLPTGDQRVDQLVDQMHKLPDNLAGRLAALENCVLHPAPAMSVPYKVHFGSGLVAGLRIVDQPNLDAAVADIKKAPFLRIEVAGYADTTGKANGNQSISEKRAQQVANLMARQAGVPSSSIVATGKGAVQGSPDESRRAEITIFRGPDCKPATPTQADVAAAPRAEDPKR